jgi:hypothetical protein
MSMTTRVLETLARPGFTAFAFLLFVLGNAVILPQVGRFEALSGGLAVLEVPTQLGSDLRGIVASYPEEAVAHYLGVLLPIDVVYPATAGLFFASLLTVLTRRARGEGSAVRRLPWLGVAMVAADWLENAFVFGLLVADAPSAGLDVAARVAIAGKVAVGSATVLTTLGLAAYTVGWRVTRGQWPAAS